ncbi:MAG: hypothetical protein IJD51_03100 [Clostridia bacterium]|nr:hypothetical protein [Clostridia bacterium]
MSFFSKLFGKRNNTDSYSFRLNRARELHGQAVKYVTEHRDGNEDVIGRGGALCLKGDEFIVDSSGDRLFVCKVRDLEASNLMSGDGVVIKGPNLLEDGRMRTITVHFVYYRK